MTVKAEILLQMFITQFLFTDKGSSDDLQDLEDSLALANRELNSAKDSTAPFTTSSMVQQSPLVRPHIQQPRVSVAPILEDADDLTRQIAEEVMKQNIGPGQSIGGSICNGDAEESIKAIARSLSNTGLMLAAEAKQKSQTLETPLPVTPAISASVPRSVAVSAYSTLEYFPPNVAIQNIPLTSSSGGGLMLGGVISNKTPVQISQVFPGHSQGNVIPQNVTVTPQGIITSHIPTTSVRHTVVPALPQSLTTTSAALIGTQPVIPFPSAQQLTAQQLSALVQQAAAQLPPLPPYKPRQQRVASSTSSVTIPHIGPAQIAVTDTGQKSQTVTVAGIRPIAISTTATAATVAQDIVVQQLNRQQEQLLAQQILQQKLATLTAPSTIRVTLPSNQNLGFSTILQQGQIGRLNQGVVQALPNVGQITHLVKTDFSTSQISAPVTLPTTNIVWTSPPNVTITTPNGLPRPLSQTKPSNSKFLSISSTSSTSAPVKETFIDLTEADPPPPYEATQSAVVKTVPPPVYPTQTTAVNTTVTGKS